MAYRPRGVSTNRPTVMRRSGATTPTMPMSMTRRATSNAKNLMGSPLCLTAAACFSFTRRSPRETVRRPLVVGRRAPLEARPASAPPQSLLVQLDGGEVVTKIWPTPTIAAPPHARRTPGRQSRQWHVRPRYSPRSCRRNTSAFWFDACNLPCSQRAHTASGARSASVRNCHQEIEYLSGRACPSRWTRSSQSDARREPRRRHARTRPFRRGTAHESWVRPCPVRRPKAGAPAGFRARDR